MIRHTRWTPQTRIVFLITLEVRITHDFHHTQFINLLAQSVLVSVPNTNKLFFIMGGSRYAFDDVFKRLITMISKLEKCFYKYINLEK